MSDDFDHLTDEDYEAIAAIVDGSARRAHGQDLLSAIESADKRREETASSLFDAITRATLAQEEGEQE